MKNAISTVIKIDGIRPILAVINLKKSDVLSNIDDMSERSKLNEPNFSS
mgnify:CR=1 FL=1